jgi:mannose-6-phosphate isomerase-like protein (cupin superfamily)
VPVIPESELNSSNYSRDLVGADHGGLDVSLIFVEAPPGSGPSLHRHPYDEVFIVHEGEGTFTLGDEESLVGAGTVVIVPAGTPHGFVNSGGVTLRLTAIHTASQFATEWLV